MSKEISENEKKINKMKGDLLILKTLGIKPNFSQLERDYGIDRHTISNYYNGFEPKSNVRNKSSKLDPYYDEIKDKMQLRGVNIKGVYEFFYEKHNEIGCYSNFKTYVKKHNLKPEKDKDSHPRYETEPGEQLQFDWKEDLKMVSKHGEIFEFNIFSATLGFSRLHNFVYTKTKTREDLERCLISTFKYMNGVPKTLLTDNMRAAADITDNKAKVNKEFNQFVKDMGTTVKLCQPYSPQTKGKDETANKFMTWLIPYNHEFEDEQELLKIITNIRNKVNLEANQTTNMPPILLYKKEKEYLSPLPNKNMMDSYLIYKEKSKVTNDSLVYYKGQRYSVSPKYINQFVSIKQTDNILNIYHNNELIATHEISNKIFNYSKSDYIECLKATMPYKDENDILKLAQKNLNNLDKLLINKDKKEGNNNDI